MACADHGSIWRSRPTSRPISLSRLESAPPEEREGLLWGLVGGTRRSPDGEVAKLDAGIREYERRYEVSSERMMRELAEGKRQETAEVASWIMRLRIRERLGAVRPG